MREILGALFALFICINTHAQVFLQLNRYGNPEPKRFYIQDNLYYQSVDYKDQWLKREIDSFLIPDSTIVFTDGMIKVNTITKIKIFKPLANSIGTRLIQFGAVWLLYGTAAHIYYSQTTPWDSRVWGVSLGSIASGWLTKKLFSSKTYSINDKNRLKIMDLTF